jgi:hypothetical protein
MLGVQYIEQNMKRAKSLALFGIVVSSKQFVYFCVNICKSSIGMGCIVL